MQAWCDNRDDTMGRKESSIRRRGQLEGKREEIGSERGGQSRGRRRGFRSLVGVEEAKNRGDTDQAIDEQLTLCGARQQRRNEEQLR